MDTLSRLAKLERFAELLHVQTKERLEADKLNTNGCNEPYTRVIEGNKYSKVDRGNRVQWSGAYMVDKEGNIFGIKAYGQIHRGHQYGTLDTINEWYWGDYYAYKLQKDVLQNIIK